MSEIYVTAGSAAVVAFLVLMVWLMGFRTAARLDDASLAQRLAESEPGARIADCVVSADGRAALARLTDGKLLIARAVGDGVSLRSLPVSAAQVRFQGPKAVVTFADWGFPPLHLALKDEAPGWLKALSS
jgi:hypothetical protein